METAGQVRTPHYRFLCGADMEPGVILATYAGATFIARARRTAGEREVWGILIQTSDPPSPGEAPHAVETDDGRHFSAHAPHGPTPSGDPASILAEARYWELPPHYIARLVDELGQPAGADESQ